MIIYVSSGYCNQPRYVLPFGVRPLSVTPPWDPSYGEEYFVLLLHLVSVSVASRADAGKRRLVLRDFYRSIYTAYAI